MQHLIKCVKKICTKKPQFHFENIIQILLGSHKRRENKQVYRTGKAADTVHCESIPIYRRDAADQYFKG